MSEFIPARIKNPTLLRSNTLSGKEKGGHKLLNMKKYNENIKKLNML
jgi:hypothetical protein